MDQTGNNAGWSELWWAVENLDADTVRGLLEGGADPNEPGSPPLTSLLHLAINGEAAELAYGVDPGIEVTRMLVEHGADLRDVDASGETPIQFARSAHHPEAIRFLEAKLAEPN